MQGRKMGDVVENAMTQERSEHRRRNAAAIAKSFVAARRDARSLAEFPGTIPPDLEAAVAEFGSDGRISCFAVAAK
jgi:hypothetical protein